MANTKISNLTEDTAPTGGNYFPEVDDTAGTPVTKYVKGLHLVEMGERNYKIVVTIASNNITVALKNLAGNDFSAVDPLVVKIGNSWRTVTAALSVTVNAGANSFNAGAAELATKEIDYFIYLGYRTASTAVVILFSRYPNANVYSEFSATATNEKYAAFSTAPAATDDVVNIGRIAATLSAGAGYTWTSTSQSAPTSINTIQKPIFESRVLTYVPQWTSTGTAPAIGNSVIAGFYKVRREMTLYNMLVTFGSTATFGTGTYKFSLPMTPLTWTNSVGFGAARMFDSSASLFYFGGVNISATNLVQFGVHGVLLVTSLVPFTWAQSDAIIFEFETEW